MLPCGEYPCHPLIPSPLTFPSAIATQKLPLARLLGLTVIFSGIITPTIFSTTDTCLFATLRGVGGVVQAATLPCLILLTSQWYTKREQPLRFSLWFSGQGLGRIIKTMLTRYFVSQRTSSGQAQIGEMNGSKLYIVILGGVTVCLGIIVLFALPDTPMNARFMSEKQTVALLKHVSVNHTGIKHPGFKWDQISEVVKDPQIWILGSMVALVSSFHARQTLLSRQEKSPLSDIGPSRQSTAS